MAQFHNLTIKDITKNTANAVVISFLVPENLKSTFAFKAGQYITLKATIDGNDVRRDYSLCVSPKSNELKVVVKMVSEGVFSVFANTSLRVGDVLEVSKPNGRFVFLPNPSTQKTIVAFAAGSGITPIMSIAKTVLQEETHSKFVLVYGNKTPEDTIFYSQLLALQAEYGSRFDLQFMFSQNTIEGALFGRIDSATVNQFITNKYNNTPIDAFYICGPEAMIQTVRNTLADNTISDEVIFYELFKSSVSNHTKSDTPMVAKGKTQITIIVDDTENSFTMSQKDSVLDVALSQNIDVPYSCQGGVCSSCIARIKEGSATMRQNNILTDAELAEGLVLTCQAEPTTATLIIDYDDV